MNRRNYLFPSLILFSSLMICAIGEGAAQQYTLTVVKAGSGSGTVTSSPAGINCGSDCSEPYNQGTKITLKVKADPGSTFKGWSGGCTGTSPTCKLTLNSDQTVTATFALPDLRGELSDISIKSSSAGYEVSGKLTVHSDDAKATGVEANIYLSNDDTYDGSDTLLGSVTIGTINAGASKFKTYKYKGLNNPSGKYVIGVIDRDNTVKESNENNNTVVSDVIVVPIPDAQRLRVLDSVTDKFVSLPGENPEAEIEEMVSFLQSFPEVEEAGVSEDSSIWARFTDQRLLIIVNNRRPSEEAEATFFPQSLQSGETPEPSLPDSSQFRLLNSLGTCFRSPNNEIASWLTANGYTPESNDATVEGLKKVSGDGVFYFNAHGGTGDLRGEGPNAQRFAIWTATEVNDANDKAFAADLDDGSLCYMIAEHDKSGGGCTKPKHYAITYKFVKKYMSFADDSFVFINACSSFTSTALKEAFFEKGASVFEGWTNSVKDDKANFAAKFVFDRLLGANKADPVEDPMQRPFDYVQIWEDMVARGYDDSGAGGKLKFELSDNFIDGDFFGLLAPSIEVMWVDESNGELHIWGLFGLEKGEVTVGGQEVNIKQWEPWEIICDLPPNLAGDVYVEEQGHKSNVVPLTEWRGQFRYIAYEKGLYIKVTCDVHFRGDIHGHRSYPHEEPDLTISHHWYPTKDSKCIYEAGGTSSVGDICPSTFTLSGSGECTSDQSKLDWEVHVAEKTILFNFSPCVKADTRICDTLCMGWITPQGICTDYICSPDCFGLIVYISPDLWVVELNLDANFAVQENSQVGNEPGYMTPELQWDRMEPKYVPDIHNTPAKFK